MRPHTLLPAFLALTSAWRVEWTLLDGTRLWSTGTYVDSGGMLDTTNCMTVPWDTPQPINSVEWWEYKDNTINATEPGWFTVYPDSACTGGPIWSFNRPYYHSFAEYFGSWGYNPPVGSYRVYWSLDGGAPPPSQAEREAAEREMIEGIQAGNATGVGNGTVVRRRERIRREVSVRV